MAVALFLDIGSRDFVAFAELLNQLVAGNLIRPGACFNADPKALDEQNGGAIRWAGEDPECV